MRRPVLSVLSVLLGPALAVSGVAAAPASAATPAGLSQRLPAVAAALDGERVSSPDGSLDVSVAAVAGRLTYQVVRDGTTTVVAPSGLGMTLRQPAIDLTSGMRILSAERRTVDETWTPAWGTSSRVRNHAQELTVHAEHVASGALLDVVFRVFDDGVGFRYHLPAQAPLGTQAVVSSESSVFALPSDMTAYYIAAGRDWNADEKHYMTVPLPQVPTAQTPVTTSRADGLFVTVHEADLTDYPSMTLRRNDAPGAAPGELVSDLIALPNGDKAVLPIDADGFDTPWRTLTIGREAGDLAESHLIENLNDPCAVCDVDSDGDGVDDTTDWIDPATYTGVWWELQRRATTWNAGPTHGATTERTKAYIDLAARAGARFVLAEGWNTNSGGSWTNQDFTTPQADFDLADVLAYGRSHGVGFIAHNETRGYVDYYDQNVERIFSRYEELGIHAIKTGYATRFELGGVNRSHYDQEAVRHYQRVVDAAARHDITVNAHEAIKPTGLNRTYPNMMTGEGVAGMEQQNYMGANGNPPAQATILPFTRFMGGPADYTPGVLDVTWDPARLGTRVQTTTTAQLALYTTFYSPLQMLADTPENYARFPEAFDYLTGMPATWDESHVDAVIGDHTVTARRSGDAWWVGVLTDEQDRRLDVPLDFLDAGTTYTAEIWSDAADTTWRGNPLPVEVTKALVTRDTVLRSSLVGGGGQALRLRPATSAEQTSLAPYAAPTAELVGAPRVSYDARRRTVTLTATVRNAGSTVGQAVFSVDGRQVDAAAVRVGAGAKSEVSLELPADSLPYPGPSRLEVGNGTTEPTGVSVELLPAVTPRDRADLEGLAAGGDLAAGRATTATAYLERSGNRRDRGDFVGAQRAVQGLRLMAERSPVSEVSPAALARIDAVATPFLGAPTGVSAALRAIRDLEASRELAPETVSELRTTAASVVRAAVTGDDTAARTGLAQLRTRATALAGDGPALTALRTVLAGLTQADQRLEAESGTLLNGASRTTEHPGYTGTGFVKALTKAGAGVGFTVTTTAAASYDVVFRFANGMTVAPLDRQLTATANGEAASPVRFANQGQDADRWRRWALSPAVTMPLRSGANDLTLSWVGQDTGNVNVDHVVVRPSLGVLPDAALDDLTAPAVTLGVPSRPGAADGTWSPVPVAVSVTAADAVDGSPLTETRVDAGAWTPYTGPVEIAGDGLHTISVRSLDAAGNLAAPAARTIGIDTGAPTVGFDVVDGARSVAVLAADAVSGVASTDYRVDGGPWMPYTSAVTLAEASSVLEARTTDRAGNRTAAAVRVTTTGETATVPAQGGRQSFNGKLKARQRPGRDVLLARGPDAAAGATVRLYELRGSKRVLLRSTTADFRGDARFGVSDRSRDRRTYRVRWVRTSATLPSWSQRITVR